MSNRPAPPGSENFSLELNPSDKTTPLEWRAVDKLLVLLPRRRNLAQAANHAQY